MADLITHSLTFSKESVREYFIKPLFVTSDIRQIVTVRTDIKSSEKLDFIDNLDKITKAYAQGTNFTSSTGVTITQKTLTVKDMKAQVEQNGKAFANYVKQELLKKGVDENDISDTLFEQIVMEIFMAGLMRDLQRQLFFGQTEKETVSSNAATGSADTDYNVYDGFWTLVFELIDASTIPSGQVVELNSSTYVNTVGVKQVATTTLTGTSGTANITVNGTAYLATFDTNLTTTATNFVTSHASTIAARYHGAAVTSSGADVVFTANIAGVPITVSNAVNAGGNLAGTTAATTANTAVGTLKDDAALSCFETMWESMSNVLRARIKTEGRFITTTSLYDNYTKTIENLNGSDAAHSTLINGVSTLTFRGVPIMAREEWDEHIENDLGGEYKHRAMLTIPRNLVVGTDGESDDVNVEMWYEKKDQVNYVRVEYKAGTQLIHPELVVIARS